MQLIETELLETMHQSLKQHEEKVLAAEMTLDQINENTTRLTFEHKGKSMCESISAVRAILRLNKYPN